MRGFLQRDMKLLTLKIQEIVASDKTHPCGYASKGVTFQVHRGSL